MTLSREVAAALRVKAAAHSQDIGTLTDDILRLALQPVINHLEEIRAPLSIARVETEDPTPQNELGLDDDPSPDLEEQFFIEVMKCIDLTTNLEEFTDSMASNRVWLKLTNRPSERDLPAMEKEIQSWIKERKIPKEWQPYVFSELRTESEALPDFLFNAGMSPEVFFYGTEA
jgi:plasmid stability protein